MRWRKFILFILAATACVVFSSCKPKQITLNGQIFIATEMGASLRLGAVEVLLVEKGEATNCLQKTMAATILSKLILMAISNREFHHFPL
jgi:hypothetical protein